MSSNKKINFGDIDKEKEIKKSKLNLKKSKSLLDLFPSLPQKPKGQKINVLIDNKKIFIKVGLFGKESIPYYVVIQNQ